MSGHYTPLRYPGGKAKLAGYVARVLERNQLTGGTYVEPYAGGCGVALELLLAGEAKRIHINDLNPAIFTFWKCVLTRTDELIRRIERQPVTVASWKKLRAVQSATNPDEMDLAFSTFFLNRTNRSGIIFGGGVIGGLNQDGPWKINARYNAPDLIKRIEAIADYASYITLHNEDAERLVKRIAPKLAKKSLIYFDPPYYVKGSALYMNHYLPEDHVRLAGTIAGLPCTVNWMVSYDSHPTISKLYKEFRHIRYTLSYSAAQRAYGHESLYFSKGLVAPAPMSPMRNVRATGRAQAA